VIQEYKTILESLIDSYRLFPGAKDPKNFAKFLEAKRKKMNMEMMILCDCVTTKRGADQSDLFAYIRHLSEICEVRAIA
jgi:hypothetical protein